MSYAKCQIQGFIVKDAETFATKTDKMVVKFALSVSWGEGEKRQVSFFNIETWIRQADYASTCLPNLFKGAFVQITGFMKQERYETKDGKKQSQIKVTANTVEVLKPGKQEATGIEALGEVVQNVPEFESQSAHFKDNDIPF
jgi:single-stranded DNA-binding protein